MCALQRGTDRMNHAVHDFGPIRFSTDDLPARDRIAMWRELFGRRMLKAEFEAFSDARFFHTTTFRNLCGLTLGFSAAAGFRGTRTRPLLGDGSDDLLLTINTQGVDYLSQFGREARAGPFDGVMMSCAEWAQFSVPKPVRFMLVAVPRRPIAAMVKDPEAAAGRLLRKEMESLRLLTSYLSTADGLTFANPELRHLFVMSVYDLMALTFGATSDAAELAQNRGLRAARLSSIKSEIDARLGEGTLTVNGVAAAHGVTPRYVQLLFEREGTTFSEYLLAQRLIRAHRMLASPRFACRTIGAIAFEVGFNDLSYFNRSFRRRFGATPSDVRANLAGGVRPATHDPAIRQIKRTLRFTDGSTGRGPARRRRGNRHLAPSRPDQTSQDNRAPGRADPNP
jgi:AraC-like DNA-binding protein